MNIFSKPMIIIRMLEYLRDNHDLNISSMCCTNKTISFYITINSLNDITTIESLQDVYTDLFDLKIQKQKITTSTASTIVTYHI